MKDSDFLIIGGSAAGTTAAEVIRGLKADASITIVTDEDYTQYSRVLIPHYIRGRVSREQVFLKSPKWYEQKNIVLLKGLRAQSLDATNKTVTFNGGEEIRYGKLLIAVGGRVIPLKVPGADSGHVLYMRTVDDADRIINAAKKSKNGVIIGGGFIGLEYASCFKANGVSQISMLVREPYFWEGKLDEQSSRVLVSVLEKNGIKVLTGEEAGKIEVGKVLTKSGKGLPADVVGVGVGIRSDLEWLDGSAVKINRGILANEYLETNVTDIYAAGDCAEFHDVVFERQHLLGNWANATSQGNVVGKNMAGMHEVFETASSYTISFFEPPNNGSCSFIGVTEADFADEVISRGSVEAGAVTRIFIKTIGGVTRVVGATVINNPREVAPLTTAIKNKVDISAIKNKFSSLEFDLGEISRV